jgi:hypothetical protein
MWPTSNTFANIDQSSTIPESAKNPRPSLTTMSFLEREEDMDAMLAEALAFIDKCDSDGRAKRTRTSKISSTSRSLVAKITQKNSKTQSRHNGDTLCYSTQLQQRKKAELRALREQALELEQQVQLLLQRRRQRQSKRVAGEKTPPTQVEDDSREGFEKAVGEFQQRQKAERTNRKLKDIWANQNKVNGAFRHLAQRRSLLYVGRWRGWKVG